MRDIHEAGFFVTVRCKCGRELESTPIRVVDSGSGKCLAIGALCEATLAVGWTWAAGNKPTCKNCSDYERDARNV